MQVCLSTFYRIKILLMGNVHSRKNWFASSLNSKRNAKIQERPQKDSTQIDLLFPSRKSYHFCMKDEMAILRSHTHTQCLKKP